MRGVGPGDYSPPPCERTTEGRITLVLLLQPQGLLDLFSVFLSEISLTSCWHVRLTVSQTQHTQN